MPEINRARKKSPMIMTTLSAVAAATALLLASPSLAQDNQPKQDPPQNDSAITLELNKLETSDKGCSAHIVVSNPSATKFEAYKLDLVMFRKDGVIDRRFSLDLAPLRPSKREVKLFALDGTGCDAIGSFLVNDVLECRAETGPVNDCLARLKVSSLTNVEISK